MHSIMERLESENIYPRQKFSPEFVAGVQVSKSPRHCLIDSLHAPCRDAHSLSRIQTIAGLLKQFSGDPSHHHPHQSGTGTILARQKLSQKTIGCISINKGIMTLHVRSEAPGGNFSKHILRQHKLIFLHIIACFKYSLFHNNSLWIFGKEIV